MPGKRRSGELHGHDPMRRLRCIPRLRPQAWPLALAGCWRTRAAPFTRPANTPRKPPGSSCARSRTFTASKPDSEKSTPSPKLRAVVRSAQSAPVLARFRHALLRWENLPPLPAKSTLGKALDYTLANWSLLEVYLRDGRVVNRQQPPSKTPSPHRHRQQRTWLFIGAAEGRPALRISLHDHRELAAVAASIPSITSAMSSPACLP